MNWEGDVRAALYPIIFEREPLEKIDRVVQDLFSGKAGFDRGSMVRSLKEALASDAQLSSLLPQDHDEASVRRYLSALLASLES